MNFDLRIFLYNKLQMKIFSNKGLRQVQQDTSQQGLPPADSILKLFQNEPTQGAI
jgi:hypothetical protein